MSIFYVFFNILEMKNEIVKRRNYYTFILAIKSFQENSLCNRINLRNIDLLIDFKNLFIYFRSFEFNII